MSNYVSNFVNRTREICNRGLSRFTLIELLVVVAVISILIAMLLPALKKAKHSAILTVCVNQQRQLGIGIHNYVSDYDGYLLSFTKHTVWDRTTSRLAPLFKSKYVTNDELMVCPSQFYLCRVAVGVYEPFSPEDALKKGSPFGKYDANMGYSYYVPRDDTPYFNTNYYSPKMSRLAMKRPGFRYLTCLRQNEYSGSFENSCFAHDNRVIPLLTIDNAIVYKMKPASYWSFVSASYGTSNVEAYYSFWGLGNGWSQK